MYSQVLQMPCLFPLVRTNPSGTRVGEHEAVRQRCRISVVFSLQSDPLVTSQEVRDDGIVSIESATRFEGRPMAAMKDSGSFEDSRVSHYPKAVSLTASFPLARVSFSPG